MRKVLLILLVSVLVATIVYRNGLPRPQDRVGRAVQDRISVQGVKIRAIRSIFISRDPVRLWAYAPDPAIMLKNGNDHPVRLRLVIGNVAADNANSFTGEGLAGSTYDDDTSSAVLTIKALPHQEIVIESGRGRRTGKFRFAIMGDSRGDARTLALILKQAGHLKVEWLINLGDLVDKGREREYQEYATFLRRSSSGVPVFMTPGNHDIDNGGGRHYAARFGPGSYSFDYGRWHFTLVESSTGSISASDRGWLDADLGASIMPQAVVLTHYPLDDPRRGWRHQLNDKDEISDLKTLFEKNRVALVATSHIHGYFQYMERGVKYLVTGGAGASLIPNAGENHFIVVDVDGDDMRLSRVDVGTGDPWVNRLWYQFKGGLDLLLKARLTLAISIALIAVVILWPRRKA